MFRLKVAMIVGGGLLVFMGVQELRLLAKSSGTPQEIRLADLAARGCGDNANIVLTDFIACPTCFVYESEQGREQGPYKVVYVPALELGGEWHREAMAVAEQQGDNAPLPSPRSFQVILKLRDVPSQKRLWSLLDKDTVRGMVINSIESIGSEERRLLSEGYRGVDVSNCYIIEIDRQRKSIALAGGMLAGGGALVLLGVGWLVVPWRKQRAAAAKPVPAPAPPTTPTDLPAPPTTPTDRPASPVQASTVEDDNPYARNS